jgi:hypothetical protein
MVVLVKYSAGWYDFGMLEKIRQEWQMIRGAPWSLATLTGLICLVLWMVFHWMYSERLLEQEKMIEVYKQKLEMAPYQKSRYAAMNNTELKDAALALAKRIRDWAAYRTDLQGKLLAEFARSAVAQHKGPTDQRVIGMDLDTDKRWKDSQKLWNQWDQDFGQEPTVILSEMYGRLPVGFPKYASQFNRWEIEQELDRVGRSLPQ